MNQIYQIRRRVLHYNRFSKYEFRNAYHILNVFFGNVHRIEYVSKNVKQCSICVKRNNEISLEIMYEDYEGLLGEPPRIITTILLNQHTIKYNKKWNGLWNFSTEYYFHKNNILI